MAGGIGDGSVVLPRMLGVVLALVTIVVGMRVGVGIRVGKGVGVGVLVAIGVGSGVVVGVGLGQLFD